MDKKRFHELEARNQGMAERRELEIWREVPNRDRVKTRGCAMDVVAGSICMDEGKGRSGRERREEGNKQTW